MTVLHLAAKFGHVDVLEVLRGKVPWSMASVKVKMRIYCHVFIRTQSGTLSKCCTSLGFYTTSRKVLNM